MGKAPKAPRRAVRRSLSNEEDERVRAAVRALIPKYGTQSALAAALNVVPTSLSNYLAGRFNAGNGFARSVAEASGLSIGELLGWKSETLPTDTDDPYPTRATMLALARRGGFDARAIDKLRAVKLPKGMRDLSGVEWVRRLLRYQDEVTDTLGSA